MGTIAHIQFMSIIAHGEMGAADGTQKLGEGLDWANLQFHNPFGAAPAPPGGGTRRAAPGNGTVNGTGVSQYDKLAARESILYGTAFVLTAILVGVAALHGLVVSGVNWYLEAETTRPAMAFPMPETYVWIAAWCLRPLREGGLTAAALAGTGSR
jgi:hypothetical protein